MNGTDRGSSYTSDAVDDGRLAILVVGVPRACLLAHERPEALEVDRRAGELVLCLVEIAHTDLTKVAGVAARSVHRRVWWSCKFDGHARTENIGPHTVSTRQWP
eukprot:6181191-Pleurochrysis_carterae.AAC.4